MHWETARRLAGFAHRLCNYSMSQDPALSAMPPNTGACEFRGIGGLVILVGFAAVTDLNRGLAIGAGRPEAKIIWRYNNGVDFEHGDVGALGIAARSAPGTFVRNIEALKPIEPTRLLRRGRASEHRVPTADREPNRRRWCVSVEEDRRRWQFRFTRSSASVAT
jgi:hypothetical protein